MFSGERTLNHMDTNCIKPFILRKVNIWIILCIITAATDDHGREETPCCIFTSRFGGCPEMHPWGKPGMVRILCWKMLNQNSLQRTSELQLCKGGSRMHPNKMFSGVS